MSLLTWVSLKTINLSQEQSFPSRLSNLILINTIDGNKAISEISQMHPGNITLTNAYILSYANGNNWAKVWISISKSEKEAEGSKQRMFDRLQNNYMFSPPKLIKVDSMKIFKTIDRQNQIHYFYSLESNVIWIGTNLNLTKAKLLLKESIYKLNLSL
jgi:hypothetical protein